MNIKIESNCLFSVSAIQYSATGELCITLNSDKTSPDGRYQYTVSLGSGQAEEKPTISLLQYAKDFAASANIKSKTKDSYRLMYNHLEKYGDIPIDKVTTPYLQDFILNLQTMYEYDPAGHLTRETNPLGQIFYHYTYYRLAHKRYSDMTENNVTYSYGDVGRATGRPVRIVDGSGVQTFEYDALGNVSKSIRVLSVPASGYAYAFTHNFEYDSWGRIWSMTYPDGERVDYRYNHAGDLTLMTGDKWGNPRTYIADILYTKYGQRKRIDYGNGTHTEYAYDSLQRLAFLHSEDISHNPMQHTEYSYNKVGNITGLANNAGGIGGMGGLYSNSYYYDPMGRLVASNGSDDIGGQPRNYTMEEMQYSPSGRIGTKHLLWQSVTTRGIQHMEYFYSNSNDKPHAPRLIVNNATGGLYDLVWDGAGNLVHMAVRNEPAVDYSNRILHWTEDNRLFAVADESHFSYYAYDHNGERTLKMTGDAATVDQNALEQHVFTSLNHVTLYPSPYIVLTEQGYTKHYYAGADRLAARLGSGGLSRDTSCVRSNENLVRRTDELFRHSCERVNSFNYRNHEELELVRIDGSIFDSVFEFDRNAASRHLYADVKPRPGAIHNLIVSHSTHNTRSAPTPEEPDVYFYHSDHLGSASWITNAAGMPIQHLQYLPFGERFVDQRSTGYSERFTFTGKERDEETGFGYFGARYMDYELMTMWLSVDPLADKYPNISPYHYCHWSPIVVVDSWGESDRKFTDYETGEYLGEIDDGVDETVRITQEDFVTLQKLYKNDENRGDEKHTNYNEMIEMYSIGKVGYDIAQTAKKYEGSTAWAYNTKKDKFGKDTHKCNQFVDDVLKECGINIPGEWPPRAGDWADKTKPIVGFSIVAGKPHLGDIVSGGKHYRDASGHVAIVTGIDVNTKKITTISAGRSSVTENNFGESLLRTMSWLGTQYESSTVRRAIVQ